MALTAAAIGTIFLVIGVIVMEILHYYGWRNDDTV